MSPAPGPEIYESRLLEIGRITTTWAKFEHWIDQAIWLLAKVDPREGACITTQIGSIHGKFRALQALMAGANRPQKAQAEVASIAGQAADVVLIRNRFAHGPLDMGINFETREYEVYLRNVAVRGKTLQFVTSALTHEELVEALKKVNDLYQRLLKSWALIVGVSSADALAPPHE